MTDKQPEALSVAKRLKNQHEPVSLALRQKAAAELRRLHEVNAELVGALRLIQPIRCDNLHHEKKHRHSYTESCPVKEWIEGVIAKAQGDNNE